MTNKLVIVPPNIQAIITGVIRIERQGDNVTLIYTNNTTEVGTISSQRWAKVSEHVFSIVSEIQSQRAK